MSEVKRTLNVATPTGMKTLEQLTIEELPAPIDTRYTWRQVRCLDGHELIDDGHPAVQERTQFKRERDAALALLVEAVDELAGHLYLTGVEQPEMGDLVRRIEKLIGGDRTNR